MVIDMLNAENAFENLLGLVCVLKVRLGIKIFQYSFNPGLPFACLVSKAFSLSHYDLKCIGLKVEDFYTGHTDGKERAREDSQSKSMELHGRF